MTVYVSVGTLEAHIERLQNRLEVVEKVAEAKKQTIQAEIEDYQIRLEKKRSTNKK